MLVEVKSVERLEFVFVSQMLTNLRAPEKRLGLILNFSVPVMKAGVRRVVGVLFQIVLGASLCLCGSVVDKGRMSG